MPSIPPVLSLKGNYPTESKEDLVSAMGFDEKEALDVLKLWENTCAIRLSYCLLKCGVDLGVEPGRGRETLVRGGPAKDKHFWMSQNSLSNRLIRLFGKPTYRGQDQEKLIREIGRSGGVISFMDLAETWWHDRYRGGHIDVVFFADAYVSDSYKLKIDEVGSLDFFRQWGGFSARCGRASEIRFWRSSA